MSSAVIVCPYSEEWPRQFSKLKALLWIKVSDLALAIEHVGSTSVQGLAAKPIIDIDIVISDLSLLPQIADKLASLGYEHRGNLGIENREAFRHPQPEIKHNLYVCPSHSEALLNHLSLRDALRENTALRDEYGSLKFRLAEKFPNSIDDYIEGKTDFILKVLAKGNLGKDSLEAIRKMNLAPKSKS